MDWKLTLKDLFEQGKYISCLDILYKRRMLVSNSDESFIIDINLIYTYEYILVESCYTEEEFKQYVKAMKALLKKARMEYKQKNEFLFYISYIATSYMEYFMGLTDHDAQKIACKILQKEPKNLLYQWLVYNYTSYGNIEKERCRIECAKKILEDNNYILNIKNMLLAGDDLLFILQMDAREIEESQTSSVSVAFE